MLSNAYCEALALVQATAIDAIMKKQQVMPTNDTSNKPNVLFRVSLSEINPFFFIFTWKFAL